MVVFSLVVPVAVFSLMAIKTVIFIIAGIFKMVFMALITIIGVAALVAVMTVMVTIDFRTTLTVMH